MDDSGVADAAPDLSQPTERCYSVRPVTIRQLNRTRIRESLTRAGTNAFRYSLDGNDFFMATFVGNIIDVVASSETTWSVRVEDGTGKITSTHAIGEEAEDPPRWRAGTYARVFGVPRKFNGVVVFNAYFIRPIEDPHEVFFHLMEAMVVTLGHARGQPPRKDYESKFVGITVPSSHPLTANQTADQDNSISTGWLVLGSPPLRGRLSPIASTSQVSGGPRQGSRDSVKSDDLDSTGEAQTTDTQGSSDNDDGTTEYYSGQSPDPPLEDSPSPSPSPAPMPHPFGQNHSYEGHSDEEEGSSQPSQSTVRQIPRPRFEHSDEESEDGQTPKGKGKGRERGSDEEFEVILTEFSSQTEPRTPPRRMKPDPYAEWSPAKRNVMLLMHSRTPGVGVNVRRSLGEGMSKLEVRHALKELEKEGEIERVNGIDHKLVDKGLKYPRF